MDGNAPRRRALPAGLLLAILVPALARAQGLPGVDEEAGQLVGGQGWAGFLDWTFIAGAFLTLLLATALGGIIAYHPRHLKAVDRLDEAELPKIYLMYAVVGALIGIMVLKYGLVVGFVVFGIGGLMRFRTDLDSPPQTGRLILVTLIGLSCGLALPHVAVLATAFAYILIYLQDARVTYRIEVKGLEPETLVEAAEAYRRVLAQSGCRILGERRSFGKETQASFIFRAPHSAARPALEARFARDVPQALRGAVDWETA